MNWLEKDICWGTVLAYSRYKKLDLDEHTRDVLATAARNYADSTKTSIGMIVDEKQTAAYVFPLWLLDNVAADHGLLVAAVNSNDH